MKKISVSLAIKAIKIKIILASHLTPVKMTILKKTNKKMLAKMEKFGNLPEYAEGQCRSQQ